MSHQPNWRDGSARLLFFGVVLLYSLHAWAAEDVWTGIDRIVAVGDVHGDYEQFVTVLRETGVIDRKGRWAGGKTHLVQTGDVVDRGAGSRKATDLIMTLEKQAQKAGGAENRSWSENCNSEDQRMAAGCILTQKPGAKMEIPGERKAR